VVPGVCHGSQEVRRQEKTTQEIQENRSWLFVFENQETPVLLISCEISPVLLTSCDP